MDGNRVTDSTDSSKPRETLQELVLRRLEELDISAHRAAKDAQSLVSYETLRFIARGEHKGRLSNQIAQGIALALKVPVERVYRAAGILAPEDRWEWPEEFDAVPKSQRWIPEAVAAGLKEAYAKGYRDALGG
jgi:hypothetical protein